MPKDYNPKFTHEERIELAKKSEYGAVFFSENGPVFYGKDGSFSRDAPVPLNRKQDT